MKEIVVINQPINNRGDQAAHRAFMSMLLSKNYNVNNVFFGKINTYEPFFDKNTEVNYTVIKGAVGERSIRSSIRKFFKTAFAEINILPGYKKFSRLLKNSDAVICAPGGVCLGPYRNWDLAWNLNLALKLNPKVALWSRSIGPFSKSSKTGAAFFEETHNSLRKIGFLGLRDKKSQQLAEKLDYNFQPMIDSAFAYVPQKEIPDELKKSFNYKYVVMVPNQLYTWHPDFTTIPDEKLDNLYVKIIKRIIDYGFRVVMLPQLFNRSGKGDFYYFKSLVERHDLNEENITIISEEYDSDTQQAIIRNARLVIGARYHSVIFSINNHTPFVCLSYEHKMVNTLEILGMSEFSFDIKELVKYQNSESSLFDSIERVLADNEEIKRNISEKQKVATDMVHNAFEKLHMYIETSSNINTAIK